MAPCLLLKSESRNRIHSRQRREQREKALRCDGTGESPAGRIGLFTTENCVREEVARPNPYDAVCTVRSQSRAYGLKFHFRLITGGCADDLLLSFIGHHAQELSHRFRRPQMKGNLWPPESAGNSRGSGVQSAKACFGECSPPFRMQGRDGERRPSTVLSCLLWELVKLIQ